MIPTDAQRHNARRTLARMEWAKAMLQGESCVNAKHLAALRLAERVRADALRYGEDVAALDRAVAAFEGGQDV